MPTPWMVGDMEYTCSGISSSSMRMRGEDSVGVEGSRFKQSGPPDIARDDGRDHGAGGRQWKGRKGSFFRGLVAKDEARRDRSRQPIPRFRGSTSPRPSNALKGQGPPRRVSRVRGAEKAPMSR